MKYKDLRVGDWFERDGYKYIKTASPDGYPNMRLNANEKHNEQFGYCGDYFPQDEQVNFLTSWEYNSPVSASVDGDVYEAKKSPYNILLKYYGKKLYLVKKSCNRKDMFLVIYSNELFFEAGHWYALLDTTRLIYVQNENFEYKEFEGII